MLRTFSGDHTGKETPVPIPNTAVKLSGPMIVPTSAKVGIARFYSKNPAESKDSCGVFVELFRRSADIADLPNYLHIEFDLPGDVPHPEQIRTIRFWDIDQIPASPVGTRRKLHIRQQPRPTP